MSTTSPQIAPLDSLAYATALHDYAAERLDAFSLRCWIIRRLMADDGLEHACAEELFERVLASASESAYVREPRRLGRERREPFRELRSRAHDWARRHLHLGPTTAAPSS